MTSSTPVPGWASDMFEVDTKDSEHDYHLLIRELSVDSAIRKFLWKRETVVWLRAKLVALETLFNRPPTQTEALAITGILCTLASGDTDYTWKKQPRSQSTDVERTYWITLVKIQKLIVDQRFTTVSRALASRVRLEVLKLARYEELDVDSIWSSDSWSRLLARVPNRNQTSSSSSTVRHARCQSRTQPSVPLEMRIPFCTGSGVCDCTRSRFRVACAEAIKSYLRSQSEIEFCRDLLDSFELVMNRNQRRRRLREG